MFGQVPPYRWSELPFQKAYNEVGQAIAVTSFLGGGPEYFGESFTAIDLKGRIYALEFVLVVAGSF